MTDEPRFMCAGRGLSDSRAGTGRQYSGISFETIAAMACNPVSLPKLSAGWFIPSTYRGPDAREHAAQTAKGAFAALAGDVDRDIGLRDLDRALQEIAGDVRRVIYSTKSATPDNRRWRFVIDLEHPVLGARYGVTQLAFSELLEAATGGQIEADHCTERRGQISFLPNRGLHYQHFVALDGPRLAIVSGHPIYQRRAVLLEDERRREAAAWEAQRRSVEARQRRETSGQVSPIDHFNETHTVGELLERYGYVQRGQSRH